VITTQGVRACLMMTGCHNPLGVTLGRNKREALVRLLRHHDLPLIENDAYGELVPPAENDPVSDSDETGLVLRCGTFSNCLSPELRVGWITAGRFRDRMLSAQFLSNGPAPWLTQQTVAEFLKHGNFDRYLRNLRVTLSDRMKSGVEALDKWGHLIRSRSCPTSGFMVWLELSPGIDSLHLYRQAADQGLSFVPGALFSINCNRSNEIALNFSYRWTAETGAALDRLMTLVQDATDRAKQTGHR
jgi:DNA-binding transcriptional MocR family regulator